MTNLGWAAAAGIVALVGYALYQKLEVKVGLKIPFVTFSFEAKGHEDNEHGKAKTEISGR
jgi:hypothetical protein